MQSKHNFKTIIEILDFLERMSYDNMAIIEVVRTCYFSYREKKAFEYYPAYLNGKRQSDIGFMLNYTQGTVSVLFKKCTSKIRFFKNWFEKPVKSYLERISEVCTPREVSTLQYLLAGKKMVEILGIFNCTKFNISLLCSHALRRLKVQAPEVYVWVYDMLSLLKTIK